MMMMMILCPKAVLLAFMPPGDEMIEVVFSQTIMGEQLFHAVAWGRFEPASLW